MTIAFNFSLYSGASNLHELYHLLKTHVMIRRLKKEVSVFEGCFNRECTQYLTSNDSKCPRDNSFFFIFLIVFMDFQYEITKLQITIVINSFTDNDNKKCTCTRN